MKVVIFEDTEVLNKYLKHRTPSEVVAIKYTSQIAKIDTDPKGKTVYTLEERFLVIEK